MDIEARLTSLERRLARSERRERFHRRLTACSSAAALLFGFLALARPAGGAKLGTELKAPVHFVDSEGRGVAELGSGNGMPYLLLLNADQEVVARVGGSAATRGGFFDLMHAGGTEAVSISADDAGGLVRTFDKQRRGRVSLGANRFGGSIALSDTDGSFAGWLQMRERGSVLQLNGKELKSVASLGAFDSDAGQLILYTPEDQKGKRFGAEKPE